MQAKKFVNFTNEDFTWSYDSISYTFKAHQEMFLEEYKANHFAQHLIDKVMNDRGIPTNQMSERKKLEQLCFPSDEEVTPLEALNIEEKKKVVKKKKITEEEFEDLTDK